MEFRTARALLTTYLICLNALGESFLSGMSAPTTTTSQRELAGGHALFLSSSYRRKPRLRVRRRLDACPGTWTRAQRGRGEAIHKPRLQARNHPSYRLVSLSARNFKSRAGRS